LSKKKKEKIELKALPLSKIKRGASAPPYQHGKRRIIL